VLGQFKSKKPISLPLFYIPLNYLQILCADAIMIRIAHVPFGTKLFGCPNKPHMRKQTTLGQITASATNSALPKAWL
jgi:hypothetical protein